MSQKTYLFSFCVLNALLPLLATDIPHSLSVAPALLGTIFFGFYYFTFGAMPHISRKTLWLCGAILSLSAISLIWAEHLDVSLKKLTKLTALLPPQILLISLIGSLTAPALKPYMHYFAYGVIGASIFLCIEVISGGFVYSALRGLPTNIPVAAHEFNQIAIVLTLYSFGAFALLRHRFKHPLSFLLLALPLLGFLFFSDSQSGQLAFIVGGVFLFAFPYRSKLAWRTLTFSLCALMLAAPFFISHIYQNYAADLQQIPIMAKAAAGHRLEIWDYVSRYALQEPLHGFGLHMVRATTFDSGHIFNAGNTVLHPHNFVIQIWAEFGLIGISALMALTYALFSTIQKQFTTAQQKIILPTLMAALVPAAFAFGLWQGWWIGALFHVGAMCLLACKFTEESTAEKAA